VNAQGSLRRYSGPIMIIHQRGVSVMYGVFSNRKGITLKGSTTCEIGFGTFRIVGILTR
jgi:hypothetical protein